MYKNMNLLVLIHLVCFIASVLFEFIGVKI